MGDTTGISWTDSTLNPWIGCQRVSPGCELCYAEVQDSRKRWGNETHWGPKAPRFRTSRSTWNKALTWNAAAAKLNKRHLVFCASLADVFEDRPELVPWRAELFSLIDSTPALTWQLLTKRPENILNLWPRYMPDAWTHSGAGSRLVGCPPPGAEAWPNLWLGTTTEDQPRADVRLDELFKVPAALHWISAEPLLGPLNLQRWLGQIGWVIVGGESDIGAQAAARPFDLNWAFALREQLKGEDGAPFFMKQLGSNAVVGNGAHLSARGPWRTDSRKGDEMEEWPQALQVQEFPA